MTKRRSFSDKFKATVALEALRGDRTAQEIAAKHKIHPTQVTTWKRQAIDGLTGVFSDKVRRAEDNEAEIKELHAKIGKLAVENDFLSWMFRWKPAQTNPFGYNLEGPTLPDASHKLIYG